MKKNKTVAFRIAVILACISLAALLVAVAWSPSARRPMERAQAAHHAEPPLGQTAVRHYRSAMTQGDRKALLPTATILDHGIYQGPEPVQPDRDAAIGIYRQVLVMGDVMEQAQARDRLVELGDRSFLNPPPRPQRANPFRADAEAARRPAPEAMAPRSDSQNVHDSTVVKAVKAALDKLSPSPISTEDTLVQVRASLKSEDAHRGLDLMERNTAPLTALNMREVEVLRKVWGRIQEEPEGSKAKDDMVEMLGSRLAECGKEASCASGRVGRVVDALSTFDERVKLRPLWALRQEMLSKASVLRDQRPPNDLRPLKDVLREAFKRDYVDEGLTTMTVVDSELAAWGDDLD